MISLKQQTFHMGNILLHLLFKANVMQFPLRRNRSAIDLSLKATLGKDQISQHKKFMIPYCYFRAFVNESSNLTCRTEKDKHGGLNFRTAGRRL